MPMELPSHELPQIENDLEGTALFQKMRDVPAAPNPMAEKREMQVAFDDVLSKLGTRAVAPEPGESPEQYLAVLGTQAAGFGPEERKGINRRSLPPAALAEICREDLAIAKAEIERPNHSLRPDEVRDVIKTDRRISDARCNPVDSIGSSTKSRVSHYEPPPSARFPRNKDGSARRNIEPLQ